MITIEEAIIIATQAHMGQKDKLGHPYILHPLRVMLSFQHHEYNEKIVALLHDVLEDTKWTVDDLVDVGVSAHQISALQCLTHSPHMSGEQYIAIVKTNPLATVVKLRDIADNLSRIEYLPVDQQDRLRQKYANYLRWIYEA